MEPFTHEATAGERFVPGRSFSDGCPTAEGIGLAHDAGNLLGAIRLYCDLLALPGVLRTEHRHYAEELRQLSARSGSLIDRLLIDRLLIDRLVIDRQSIKRHLEPETPKPQRRQAEMGKGKADGSSEPILLAEVVTACRGLLQTMAGTGPFLLAVEAGTEGCAVAVPGEAVERILVNLMKNAVEAGSIDDGHGAITVRVRSVSEWGVGRSGGIALSVEDNGSGMTAATVRKLIAGEPTTESVTPWSGIDPIGPTRGIGFRVVRELVAATGGDLRMRSRMGQGTTVEIVWACAKDAGESS